MENETKVKVTKVFLCPKCHAHTMHLNIFQRIPFAQKSRQELDPICLHCLTPNKRKGLEFLLEEVEEFLKSAILKPEKT